METIKGRAILLLAVMCILGCVKPPCEPTAARANPFRITEHESRPAKSPESSAGHAPQPNDTAGRDSVPPPSEPVAKPVPYEVTIYTVSWCGPCESMKRRDGRGNDQIRLTWVETRPPAGIPELYPTICWKDAHGGLRYVQGAMTLDRLLAIIERNNPPVRK